MSDTNDLMNFISASLRTTLDEVYQRLIDCNFGLKAPELAMFTVALLNAMGREGCWDRPTELVFMLAFAESGTTERSRNRLMRWRRGEMSGHNLAREPGLGEQRDHRLGEMPRPVHDSSSLRIKKILRRAGSIAFCGLTNCSFTVKEIEKQTAETSKTLKKMTKTGKNCAQV